MAEYFYQYPYGGISRPSNQFIVDNGATSAYTGVSCMFYGQNANIQSPLAVCSVVEENDKTVIITVGSGFSAVTAGSYSRMTGIETSYGQNIYYSNPTPGDRLYYRINGDYIKFNSVNEAIAKFIETFDINGYRNIKYNATGCILIGDSFMPIGSTAHAYVTPNLGGSISESGITVKRAGADVPFTYANGVITFTVT